MRTLFGDAGSALLISARERDEPALGPFVLGTDGSGARNLIVPAGALREPLAGADLAPKTDQSGNTRTAADLYMNGPAIYEFTARRVPGLVKEVLRAAEISLDDVDHVILHQASELVLATLQRSLAIPDEKFVRYYANCGKLGWRPPSSAADRRPRSGTPIEFRDSRRSGRARTFSTTATRC